MIITRTPYRISFFGGSTDFPAYYREQGGVVLNATINQYSYIQARVLPPFFDHRYRIRYHQTERVGRIADIQHPSVRECLRYLNYPHPLELLHSGDIPAQSGIGSSSSFTVGLLLALHGLSGRLVTKRELAEQAIEVEQNLIGEHVGSQDQYAAAFGGLNRIDFGPGSRIIISPLTLSAETLARLEGNLLFCFSGQARNSSEIMAEQVARLAYIKPELDEMKSLAEEAHQILAGPPEKLDDFGRLLDAAWRIKRTFSSKVTNSALDDIYETALKAGALGGKVCGAGGGGFLAFYVQPEKRAAVEKALERTLIVPFRFEYLGAHVIFFAHDKPENRWSAPSEDSCPRC